MRRITDLRGARSFGAGRPHYGLGIPDKPGHLAEVNAKTSVCIMIESLGALEAAGDIAGLTGVDYVSFGLHDLSQAMGWPGQPAHPEVTAAVEDASDRIRRAGKPVREDFMRSAWVNDVLVAGARQLIG